MGKTLLLADDSVTIQKVVGIAFASEDIELVTVDNGDDAVAKAREIRPDAVLADVVMPGMNGYEVCEAIKSDPTLRHVPVLLLTGTFEAFDDERAQAAGATGHVAKPFEAQVLVDRVHEILAAAPAPAPAAPPTPQPQAATPEAAAAPTGHTSDSFDFFDDDLGDLPNASSGAQNTPPMQPEPAGSDGAFAFGADDLGPAGVDLPASPAASPPALAAAPPDSTVAIMPEDMPQFAPPARPEPSLELATPDPNDSDDLLSPDLGSGPMAGGESFDFELADAPGGARNGLVSTADLAAATVLDPKGASGYDVSYSDLASSGSAAPPAPEPPAAAPDQAAGAFEPGSAATPAASSPQLEVPGVSDLPPSLESMLPPLPEPDRQQPPATPPPVPPLADLASPAEPPALAPPAPMPSTPEPPAAFAIDPPESVTPNLATPLGDEPAAVPERPFGAQPIAEPAAGVGDPSADFDDFDASATRFEEPAPAFDDRPAAFDDFAAPAAAHTPAATPSEASTPRTSEPEPASQPDASFGTAEPEPVETGLEDSFSRPGSFNDAAADLADPTADFADDPAADFADAPAFAGAAAGRAEPHSDLAESSADFGDHRPDFSEPVGDLRTPASGTHDPSALAGIALADVTPQLRAQIHDTLEKIAWESFGSVAEQIVQQAVERAERIAWEVIPPMAETLIREEIRRMKGESED